MLEYLKKKSLRKSDEAWLVVDKDDWTEEQINKLYIWSSGARNYGFSLSNPKFEYWLILHFEDGKKISTSHQCSTHLKKYFPDYNKNLDLRIITQKHVFNAINHAKIRDNPPCNDWPRTFGVTTVYRLVERIFDMN